jgi:hypothetical protein
VALPMKVRAADSQGWAGAAKANTYVDQKTKEGGESPRGPASCVLLTLLSRLES